jgi:hypothetical protein
MSPQPAILDRFGFAPFDPAGLSAPMAESVLYARQRATLLLAPLAGKRTAILADKNLSLDGKAAALAELRRTVSIDIENTFTDGTKRAQAVIDDAQRKLNGRLFGDVGGLEAHKRDALERARAELFELARDVRRDPNATVLMLDTSTGHALLGAGNAAHKMIYEIISKGALDDAKLLALAVVRSGAIGRHLLGGQAVEQAVVAGLTDRVVAEDPLAAELVAVREQGERVLNVLRGDRSTASAALARATRLDGTAPPPSARREDTDE